MVGHTHLDFRLRWTLGLYTHLSWGGISDTIQLTLWYPRTTTLRIGLCTCQASYQKNSTISWASLLGVYFLLPYRGSRPLLTDLVVTRPNDATVSQSRLAAALI